MGFKTSEWAYTVPVTGPMKAVLAALAHRANDKTHRCFPGQETLVGMTGLSRATVSRALGGLEDLGIISRQRRKRENGSRTSDEYVIDTSYVAPSDVAESNVAESEDLCLTVSEPMSHSDGAIEDQSGDHPEGQSAIAHAGASFDDFYAIWPNKKKRPDAMKAWTAAIRRADPDQILAVATEYAANLHRPAKQFVPYPATWLRNDCWDDPMPTAPEPEPDKPWQRPVGRPMTRAEERAQYVEAS